MIKNYTDTINLFAFPYAGGNKYSYNNFIAHLPPNINMVTLEPPGRGARIREPLMTDIREMAHELFEKNRQRFQEPYIFFGHSMGSWLAYLVTHHIKNENADLPAQLFLTGAGNPASYRHATIKHRLNRADFFNHLIDLGGLPGEVVEDEDMQGYIEPILRADFKAVETYRHIPSGPLEVPVTVMIGSSEKNVTYEIAQEWKNETTKQFELIVFEGGHFFINDHIPEIVSVISSRMINN